MRSTEYGNKKEVEVMTLESKTEVSEESKSVSSGDGTGIFCDTMIFKKLTLFEGRGRGPDIYKKKKDLITTSDRVNICI